MVTKTRIRKYLDEEFGKGVYDEILNGERELVINGRTYTPDELLEKNIFVRENAIVYAYLKDSEEVDEEYDYQEVLDPVLESIEMMIDRVMIGKAVIAVNGGQIVVRNLADARLYENLSDQDRFLVIRAAAGG